MPPTLPDPSALARQEAQTINTNRDQWLKFPIDRILTDAPRLAREDLTRGLTDFHRQRMSMVPSRARYPESAVWVDHILAVDAQLKALANLSDEELAIFRSLPHFVSFRGFAHAGTRLRPRPAQDEKCRTAYVPDTDRGEVVVKNVDDPITHWRPDPEPPRWPPLQDLRTDGVGNGLHMDQEPAELFPLQPTTMMRHYANDVPGAIEFLTRYSQFWGGANILLHDKEKRSAAVEKCSFSHIEVFHPGPDGRSHVSGMTCRDPKSPQGAFQRAQRQKYLEIFGLPADGPDMAFWNMCAKFEAKLSQGLEALGPKPRSADLLKLFTDPWPQGLNKYGMRIHPDQGLVGFTLRIHSTFITERRFFRWQRSQDGKTFDSTPQECSV